MIKNKRGIDMGMNLISFLILTILLIAGTLAIIKGISSDDDFLEEIYARQIALLIDTMKPGTELNLELYELEEKAKQNQYGGNIITIKDQYVKIQLSGEGGKTYSYFTDLTNADIGINPESKIKIKISLPI